MRLSCLWRDNNVGHGLCPATCDYIQVPENDTVVPHYHKRFRTCAAVGNSGGLKLARAGPAIDSHDAVLRYNGAPSTGFEDIAGVKTTFRLLNRRIGDALLSQPVTQVDRCLHLHSTVLAASAPPFCLRRIFCKLS